MPYFPKINLLLLHIPKTGGSSIEKYFKKKMNIDDLTNEHLYSKYINNMLDYEINNHSLQHLTYQEILYNSEFLNFDLKNIKNIITVVRNPYERLISELFYTKIINLTMNKKEVFIKIRNYIYADSNFDNHKIPQYLFLLDDKEHISDKIKILKTESLTDDMKNIGFKDFNIYELSIFKNLINYYSLLSEESIKLINEYYSKDFELFGYKKL
jgi:hypothetical protein